MGDIETPGDKTGARGAIVTDAADASRTFCEGVAPYDPDRLPGWVRTQQARLQLSADDRWSLSAYTRGGFWIFDRWAQAGRTLPTDPSDRLLVELMATIFSRDAAQLAEDGTVWRGIVSEPPLFEHAHKGDIINVGTGNYSSSSLNPRVASLFAARGMRELQHRRLYHYFLRLDLPVTMRAVCLMGHTSYDVARDRNFGEVLLRPGARATVVDEPFLARFRDPDAPFRCVHAQVIVEDEPILARRRYMPSR